MFQNGKIYKYTWNCGDRHSLRHITTLYHRRSETIIAGILICWRLYSDIREDSLDIIL